MTETYPLCVLTPELGALVHTFIRRHVLDLLPERTAVCANAPGLPVPTDWQPRGPVLDLAHAGGSGVVGRIYRGLARQINIPVAHYTVRRFLKTHGVKVVMGEYLDFSIPWLDAARDAGCRFYAHAHGHDVTGKILDASWRAAYRRYAEADGVITMNQPSRAALMSLGIPPERIHVVPYGVDVPPLQPHPKRQSGSPIICIAVGRMVPQKAPILLFDAFRRALMKESRLQLHYVGSGPLLPAIKEFITAFHLQESVVLHSWKSNAEVRAMMRTATLFLQHSITDPLTGDAEGLPVAILEAMAEALPVVSTMHAGIPEAVVDGETGYLVEEGDSAGMAERILSLVSDSERAESFGMAGHRRARELFTWEKERQGLLRVLGL